MGKSILLADDSVTIQKVVELTFMEEDVEVTAVGSGDGAIQKLEEGLPDLVIADVHMPGADGYEVCRFVKEKSSATPVLLLVGTFEPFNPEDVESCGGNGYLKKPFDSQELIRRVDELIGDADSQPEAPTESEPESAEDAPSSPEDLFADARTVIAPLPNLDEIRARGEAEARAGKEGDSTSTDADATEAAPHQDDSVAVAEPEAAAASVAEPEAVAPSPDAAPAEAASDESPAALSDADVDRIARRLVELVGEKTVREVAWEVVPDLAEVVIKDRLSELEGQTE